MSANEHCSRQDIYTRITASIVTQLQRGARPWARAWNAAHPAGPIARPLRHTGQAYSGINVLSLWASAMTHGFAAPIWMTYRHAGELGGQVRKGQKGAPVVHANALTKTETDAGTGDEVEKTIRYLKGYTVFNVEQIDGLPSHYYAPSAPRSEPAVRIAHAESFFAATGAAIGHGGNYALEELVAELGSAFLCADLNLALELREDHASYIGSWLEVLKRDSRAIFTAASHAQRAVDFLGGFHAAALHTTVGRVMTMEERTEV
jgi:antirestriction protein ArdC